MIGVARAAVLCHSRAMATPSPTAGGFFLVVPIIVGFVWGLVGGRAVEGAIIGLGVGLVLALIVWAIDRRRG